MIITDPVSATRTLARIVAALVLLWALGWLLFVLGWAAVSTLHGMGISS